MERTEFYNGEASYHSMRQDEMRGLAKDTIREIAGMLRDCADNLEDVADPGATVAELVTNLITYGRELDKREQEGLFHLGEMARCMHAAGRVDNGK